MSKIALARKLRILCLHGYFQDGALMKENSCALYRKLKDIADFFYLDGPIKVNSMEGYKPELGDEKIGKAWWNFREDHTYVDVDSTVKYVVDYCKQNQPMDGILGFSQGAGLALYLIALQETGAIDTNFQFVVSYSGFYPSDPDLQKVMDDHPLLTPSLHIIGKEDQIVDPVRSEKAMHCFKNPTTIYHDRGHYMFQNGEIKTKIKEFILSNASV